MNLAWVDAGTGVSGDMLLGALVDSGVPVAVMQDAIDQLDLGITLTVDEVRRCGLGATKVDVIVPRPESVRHLPEILRLLERIEGPVRERSGDVFRALAEAESTVHRIPVDEVHFHEVGSLDCIADIVGVVAGFDALGLDRVIGSPPGLGRGHAKTDHGLIPVPVPAVLELLRGIPSAAGPLDFEATTPTGAALLVCLVDEWGPMPPMGVDRVGIGAGGRDDERVANVTRLVLGSAAGDAMVAEQAPSELVQIDANVDDLDPRLWPVVLESLMGAGAKDAWLTPIVMKKGRPAHTVSALCEQTYAEAVRSALFEQTSTIGVRQLAVDRYALERSYETVTVMGQSVGVKISYHRGAVVSRSVEWEDVVRAAQLLGVAPKELLGVANAAASELRGNH